MVHILVRLLPIHGTVRAVAPGLQLVSGHFLATCCRRFRNHILILHNRRSRPLSVHTTDRTTVRFLLSPIHQQNIISQINGWEGRKDARSFSSYMVDTPFCIKWIIHGELRLTKMCTMENRCYTTIPKTDPLVFLLHFLAALPFYICTKNLIRLFIV